MVERLLLQHHPRPIRKNAVTLFSAHDITLFALLMSMGESLRQKGPYTFRDNDVYRQVDTETLYNIWPHFASTLLVEAHSSFDYSDSQLSEPDLRERLLDDVKLRFYYNHKAIMIDPDYFPVQASSYLSQPSGQSLSQVLQNSESLHQQRAQYQLKEISLRQLLYLSKHMHVFLRRE